MKKNAILTVIIIAALCFVTVRAIRFVRSLGPDTARANAELFFRCAKCGHAFRITLKQLVNEWKDVPPAEAVGGGDKAHCPKCSGHFTAHEIKAGDFARGDVDPKLIPPPPAPTPRDAIPSPVR